MIRFALPFALPLALISAPAAAAQEIAVPSGLPLAFHEVILDPDLGFARFRFVSGVLGAPGWELADISGDFGWLCDNVVVPSLEQNGWAGGQIIISMADRVFPFGEVVPEAVQYFEGYSVADGACQWEPY